MSSLKFKKLLFGFVMATLLTFAMLSAPKQADAACIYYGTGWYGTISGTFHPAFGPGAPPAGCF